MCKNYFTDEQVREIYYMEAGDSIEIGAFEFYKNLFNKAVEMAIGEVVAYQYEIPTGVDGLSRIALSRNKLNAPKDTTITQLYSVKELEN